MGDLSLSKNVNGWADSMSKILASNKPKDKGHIILSRAKKENKKKLPEEESPPELSEALEPTESQGVETSKIKKKKLKTSKPSKLQKQKELKKEWENLNRSKPVHSQDNELERQLEKIATNGVVQLFNAVNLQQKELRKKMKTTENSEFKKDKILQSSKDLFEHSLNKAKSLNKSKVKNEIKEEGDIEIKSEEEDEPPPKAVAVAVGTKYPKRSKPSWVALQDNYMLDAKLKDWDKESETDSD